MKKDFGDYMGDILDSIREVEEFTEGMTFQTFLSDKKTINAVIRSLEVMGEAAKHIPEDVREKYPDVPWKRIAGMRDKLIHEYSSVDLEIVWAVIQEEVSIVKAPIEQACNDMKEET